MNKQILETLSKYWGYTSFKQFQEQAIISILDSKDTLTVLPTGGGKSVCFQVPALMKEGMAVIVSPLISLMKDQVDFLKDIGVSAECLNSSLNYKEQMYVTDRIRNNKLKLLYVAPERLISPGTLEMLKSVKVSFFVIDEAHCISHWGHNFRAEYRQLGILKSEFKNVNVHAFTATATQEVQKDIVSQLRLDSPHLYIGNIDRPNLTYRILPRSGSVIKQIVEVLKKHNNEPGIIYCLRRSDVDDISAKLNSLGYNTLPYHAGMTDKNRKKNQDEFSAENVPIIVATIAFGMGIDRSNIRFIIHAAMPKSIEHYQQETGRSGRDSLPSECYMFYSYGDFKIWEHLLGDSSQRDVMIEKLKSLYYFCIHPHCRHKYLVNYFGQEYDKKECGACDYCLGEVDMVEEPLIIAQKILSCVVRVRERFGADHIASVLKGAITDKISSWGHDKLTTFAIMKDETKAYIRYMIEQLVGQGFLLRDKEYSTLSLADSARGILKGELVPVLAKPLVREKKKAIEKKSREKRVVDWQGVDESLFDALRKKRAELARKKNVPAYIILSDKSLRDMASVKPVSIEDFSRVFGIGEVKLRQYGDIFIEVIKEHSKASAMP